MIQIMQTLQRDLRAALAAAVVFAFSLSASASDDAPSAWLSGTIIGTMGDDESHWLCSAEVHARYFDIGSGLNHWLVRPAVGFAVTSDMRAWVGYSRYRFRSRAGDVADESRYCQELDWKVGVIGDGNPSLPGRLEQRDIDSSRETQHGVESQVDRVNHVGLLAFKVRLP